MGREFIVESVRESIREVGPTLGWFLAGFVYGAFCVGLALLFFVFP